MDVQRETFKAANNSLQNLILFDSIAKIGEQIDGIGTECDKKHVAIDKRLVTSGRINKATTAGSGVVGGFIAFFASKLFGG